MGGSNLAAQPSSEREFGEPRLEVAAPPHELVGACAGGVMGGVLGTAMATARHREGVLPARLVGAQSSSGLGQLCLYAISHLSVPGMGCTH
jgi:outer membrane lipoprotein SlyB